MTADRQLSIDEILDSYSVHALAKIAAESGIMSEQKKRPLKDDLIALLKRSLFLPDRVRAAYAALGSTERTIIDYVIYCNGALRRSRLERELVRAGLVEPTHMNRAGRKGNGPTYAPDERMAEPDSSSRALQDVLSRLTLSGLLFSAEEIPEYGFPTNAYKMSIHPSRVVYVPSSVSAHLPAVTVSPLQVHVGPVARTVHYSPHNQLREMFLYWDYVRRNQPPFLQTGFLGKRTLRAINTQLLTPDLTLEQANSERETGKLYPLRNLLTFLELLRSEDRKLVVTGDVSTGLPDFWTLDAHKQIERILKAVLAHYTPEQTYGYARSWQVDYPGGFRAILKRLAQGGGEWEDTESILDDLRGQRNSFLVSELGRSGSSTQYISAYFGNRYFTRYDDLLQAVQTREENFFADTCGGVLLQMGIVELGFADKKDARWRLVRLTSFGREVLAEFLAAGDSPRKFAAENKAKYAAMVDEGRVIVQPNFQVLAIGPVSTAILARLELCATRTKADANVFEYTLTRESLYQAEQADFAVDAVLSFLETVSGTPLPQNVLRSLQEWGAHHDRIVFRSGVSLLQSVDAATLTALLADDKIGTQIARSLSPTVALVRQGAVDALQTALFASGHLPAVTDPNLSNTDNDALVQPDGVILPVHSVPSLFLTGRVERITEMDAQGAWRLTEASVQRRGTGRAAISALLTELGALHRGDLPEPVVDAIKRWGNFYGRAALATVTLVEFESKEHRAEVIAHPRARDLLVPFAAGERALALVDSDNLAAVRQLLADLGITVNTTLGTSG